MQSKQEWLSLQYLNTNHFYFLGFAMSMSTPHQNLSETKVPTQVYRAHPTESVINSHFLLQGAKTISIAHNGALYQLRATKLGKLILTK